MRAIAFALLVACGPKSTGQVPGAPSPVAPPAHEVTAGLADERLKVIVAAHWDGLMEHNPVWATELGDHRFDDRVPSASLEDAKAWNERVRAWVTALEALNELSGSDRVARDLLLGELRDELAKQQCQTAIWDFSPRDNPLLDGNGLGERHPVKTPADGKNLATRLDRLAEQVLVRTANVRSGAARGYVANRASTEKVLTQTRDQLGQPLDTWPTLLPALEPRPSWTDDERAALKADLIASTERYRAALQQWVAMIDADVLPRARTADVGLTGIPDGPACYAALIQHHTSLPLTPDELHQTGLDEIGRLHAEVAALGKRASGTSDVQEIFRWLRTDPALHFQTEDEVEAKAAEALARAKAAIPAWFGRLPKADCEVARIPDYQAPYTTIAYYMPVVPNEKPGYYYINTYAPTTRPRHEAEVLAFHESIPGHHLQIALAQEAGDIPLFRRHFGATAFVEGWGLYSEQLADEMGLYTGDTDRFGMYSFELWRAARLVVDTGIHARGWTREQAEAFMLENTPLAANNIQNEVDRYITTPGQALAYKTGQLEIWRLRRDAEARLGDRFQIAAFHDTVLGAGAVTLPVLQEQVEGWVRSTLASPQAD